MFRRIYGPKYENGERKSRTNRELEEMSKGKAIPLQAWTGPEGSRKLRLPDFKTIGT